MLIYHHCRCLESVVYGKVKADPEYTDPELKGAYSWLEREVSFYPLFLAVGAAEHRTGYSYDWLSKSMG